MIVRPAQQDDLPHILAILEQSEMRADDVDYSRWDGVLLVAVRQSEVIGFLHAMPGRPYSVITHIAVVPAHRGGRAVSKLMESVELLLRASGYGNWFTHLYEKGETLREATRHWGAYESPDPGYLYKRIL